MSDIRIGSSQNVDTRTTKQTPHVPQELKEQAKAVSQVANIAPTSSSSHEKIAYPCLRNDISNPQAANTTDKVDGLRPNSPLKKNLKTTADTIKRLAPGTLNAQTMARTPESKEIAYKYPYQTEFKFPKKS